MSESELIVFLQVFCEFLEEHGYMDSDWRDEKPNAIEEFIEEEKDYVRVFRHKTNLKSYDTNSTRTLER